MAHSWNEVVVRTDQVDKTERLECNGKEMLVAADVILLFEFGRRFSSWGYTAADDLPR